MATVAAVVFKHHEKNDGTFNVKIRIYHKFEKRYIDTTHFVSKPHFPKKATPEFLLVDLVDNLDMLAEDQKELLKNISWKVRAMDSRKLERFVQEYGNARAKKIFAPLMSA